MGDSAHLFIDSPYWTQAQRELDAHWSLQKVGWQGTKDWLEWVLLCPRGSKIGIDSRMISHERATRLSKGLSDSGSQLVHPRQNLVDLIWKDQPMRPKDAVYVQPEVYTGKGAREKLSDIRGWIRRKNEMVVKHVQSPNSTPVLGQGPIEKITALFISNPSEVAYALNLRGSDVPYSPVFIAYLLVALDKIVLFLDLDKISAEVKKYLYECGVSLRTYADTWSYLRNKAWGEGKIIINPNTPYAVSLIIGSARYVVLPNFVEEQKAIKNETEIQGFRSACLKDSTAMCRWFAWLDQKIRDGFEVTEWEASEKLNDFRREMPLYVGLADESVSATGPNAGELIALRFRG